ncbi:MAG: Hpt domain-containing protein [Candidatus Thiodiazotropha sp. (ex Myrtea sp. 'scaly one' KF741663)]|nr:Hpt domain-containing protein [Candidatus Thiodiazotropha sp. (ex Myrtea sp. 'scaly one' KF741663)]
MTNAQDFGALNWVKDELDVSIRQARQSLEAYVESADDVGALQSCGDHLHQIARVLQMVQVYGPSMLAEEMELVVRDMQDGSVRQQEDAAEALMLALIQLPDYLEKLQGGDADIPLIILPLLNDLRAVRDAPLLSEAALFKPEIEAGRGTGRITGEPNEALPELVKRIRQKFHLGLLGWYRQRDTEQAWPLLVEVFDSIQQSAGTEQVHRLFWVAGALMHGLMEKTIAPGIAVKQLFSRIDRKLKMIIDGGEHAIQQDQSSALLKNLLYYIARAQSEDEQVRQVKEAYNLDQVLPSEDQLAQGRQGLSGSNAELAESIRDAVSIELTRIKDILDLFMRDEKADMEMLAHLEAPIRKLADTLGMIGQGALRSRLNRQADKVKGFVGKGSMPEEFELMEMAGDILFVESSLSTLHTAQPTQELAAEDGWGLDMPEGELENLIKQTVREAKVDIAKAKEVIIGYTEATDDATVLVSVRDGFKRVEGALRMLNLSDAADIMMQTGSFVQSQLIEQNEPPQRHQLNYLADVISSLEYYLETLVDGAGDRQEILSIANASLSSLLSEGGEVTEYTEPAEVIDLSGSADQTEGIELDEEAVSDLEFGESSLHFDTPELPDEVTFETETTEAAEPPAAPDSQVEEMPTASVDKPALEEIDPEILEIFVEEAREELQTIQQRFPQWRQNQHDEDALTTIRRSFHTLKGSGRLVGAKIIGELAWSVENMLNRMIEGTISASPQMMNLLDRVIDALPELIDCQEQEIVPTVDVSRLEQDAFALADGKTLEEETTAQPAPLPVEEALPADSAEVPELTADEPQPEPVTPSSISLDESEALIEMELPVEIEDQPLPHEFESDDELSLDIDTELSGFSLLSEDSVASSETGGAEEADSQADVNDWQGLDDSELDIEVDSELLSIFAEESETHLQEIESFLQLATGTEPPIQVSEEAARACHTLRGSANMAGIMPIARLAETMESYTRILHEQQHLAEAPVTDLLNSGVSCIRELLAWLPGDTLPEPPFETCLARMQRALADLDEESQDILESTDTEQSTVSEVILPPETDGESIPATDEAEDTPWDLSDLQESIELTGESEAVSEDVAYSAPVSTDEDALFELDEDQELIEIFVEESRELLETLDQDFEKWSMSPDDGAITDDIKRTLHTLKGSSRLAGVMPVGELSHALETLFNRLTGGELSFTQPLKNVVREALDRLASQTDQTAATGQVAQVDELLERIEQIGQAEEGQEMPDEDSIDPLLQQELEETEATAVELPAVDDETPSDYYEEPLSFIHEGDLYEFEGDPELVEIFIEESRELLGVLDESHAAWSENLANHGPLDEMQRALHTLKGSSRLAGIEPVGDLSHALESLLSGISVVKLEPSEAVLNASREALDLLATQTDAAESMGGIPVSDELIQRLESLLHSPAMEQEETFDPHLQEELDESASPADDADNEVEPPATILSDESLNIADDVLALDDSEAELSDEVDDSFVVMEEDILLDVGEDEELVQIFVEEAKDFVEQIETHFQAWMEQIDDLSLIEGVQRNLHTLKGSSRLAGIMPVGDLSHAVESLMTALAQEEVDPLPLVTDAARQAIDFLAHQVEMIGSIGKVPASDELVTGLHTLLGGELETAESGMVEAIQVKSESDDSEPVETEPDQVDEVSEETEQRTADIIPLAPGLEALLGEENKEEKEGFKRSKEQVRVNSELMDRLVNHAGEVSIYRARLEQQNSVLGFNLSELEQTVSRLYTQLRNLEIETEAQILYRWDRDHEKEDLEKTEFDPLEMDRFSTIQQLSRALAETVNDLGNINESLNDLQRETDTLLLQQSRISTDLQDGLLRTRMVPFAQLVPRLQRLVRQTASQLDKKANLECFGIEGELDRGILNRMIPVFEHLLRNSVSHGIERPADREQAGKQDVGRISLYVDREANDVLITLSDDGKGLDIEAIRRRAIDQGMIDANAEISDDDLIQCVLIPGFSTAKEVTQISGRGVGLDVVTSEVKQLGGSLEIDSQPGRGTSFIIRLPLTLAITDALLMRVGDEVCAIPHGSVDGVVRIRHKELMACYAGEQSGYNYAGKNYKIEYLGRMMGMGQHELPDASRWLPLLLLQTGDHQVALQVDELLGTRQVVVKSLGKQVGSVRWITGGTILADGRVALILDLAALVRMDATHAVGSEAVRAGERKRAEDRLRVMVVDDSITVRKVTSRLLERNDMDVITAKDGVEAVTMLQEQVPDIMLLDIEMPRMDGFELARHINNSVDYYGLPIIMISSRVGDKHRKRAFDLGVKRCLGKPYQEADLLDSINEVLAETRQ